MLPVDYEQGCDAACYDIHQKWLFFRDKLLGLSCTNHSAGMLFEKDFLVNNAKLPSGRAVPNDTPGNSA